MNVEQALETALRHHVAGQLAEAEAIYRQILAQDPNNMNALNLLGMVAHQAGNQEAAGELIARAIQLDPTVPYFHNNLGEVCRAMGRHAEAAACYERAVALKPDYAEAYFNLGNALRDMGQAEVAVRAYRRAIELMPDQPQLHNNLGSVLEGLGRLDEAIAAYREAVRLRSDSAETLLNLGNALRGQGRLAEALSAFQQAVVLRPDFIEAYNNYGLALQESGRLDEAISIFKQAVMRREDSADLFNNLGVALWRKGQAAEALAAFLDATRLKPDFAQAHHNLGAALRDLGGAEAVNELKKAVELRPDYADAYTDLGTALAAAGDCEGAVAAGRKAVELQPDRADFHNNLGGIYQEFERIDEASAAFAKAIELKPDMAEAHLNRALLLLLKGDYAQGWTEYEWRWRYRGFRAASREFAQPQWKGEELAGRTILLHAEQGLGDTIQMVRYAPLLAQRGARVVVECPVELRALAARVEGVAEAVVSGDPLPPFDLHMPMMSLPMAFGTTLETIPSATPYVKADREKAETWRWKVIREPRSNSSAPARQSCVSPEAATPELERGEDATLRVGLAWGGNPASRQGWRRSMALAALAPLAQARGVVFYSLQKWDSSAEPATSPPAGMRLVDLTGEMKTMDDMAAMLANLDLVITVETAAAHLAGAMGRPVWTLLPFAPAWRWMLGREDSPWYRTMRLFRQGARGEWGPVVERVAGELRKRVQGSGFRAQG